MPFVLALNLEQLCRECLRVEALDQVDGAPSSRRAGFAIAVGGRRASSGNVFVPPGSRNSNVTTPAGRGTIG